MRLRHHRRVVTVCNNDLCPFKNEITGPFFHRHSFILPSLHSSPCSHSSVFKLWRCCIRYTVILNEQWERHSVHSVSFCSFLFLRLSQSVFEAWWNVQHICVSEKSGVYVSECVSVCVCECAQHESHSNQFRIKVGYRKKSRKKRVKWSSLCAWTLTLMRSKQHWVCLHADLWYYLLSMEFMSWCIWTPSI